MVLVGGQEAETGSPSGALGAVIDLSVAHKEVLNATTGDIDFRVFLGNAAEGASAAGESCPADYYALAEAGPAPASALTPAPTPGSSATGTYPAASGLVSATLMCMLCALLL